MSRRFRYTFILVLVALGTCLAALGGWRYARASAPVNGPILLVSIDSLRPDRLGAYGHRQAKTPAIDTLARDGVVFERAYSHVPETLPSHVSLLTGRLPFETGVRDDGFGVALPSAERTLAEMLRDRGYATGAIVSSFLLRRGTGIEQGFTFFNDDLTASTKPDEQKHLSRAGADSERVAEQWLGSVGTTRAFLFLHLDEPRSAADDRTADNAAYDERVARADQAVARLVRYLKAHQLYDQSTLILTSDHGEALGDHGEQGHALLTYDSTLRVPLVIKPAAGEGAGRRVKVPVQLIDLAPTILDLSKAPRPGNLRGRALTPLLNREDGSISDSPIYAESLFGLDHFGWSHLSSVLDGHYRYIDGVRPELYDLDADPGEQQNLVETHAELVAGLREKLLHFSPAQSPDLTSEPVAAADRERFGALGYVGVIPQPMAPRSDLFDPRDGTELLEQYRAGVAFAFVGDLSNAVDRFRGLAHRAPEMADVWLALGEVAARSDRWDVALDAYKHGVQLEPIPGDASLGMASALLHGRKYDDAAQHARRVLDVEGVSPDRAALAHETLARIALARHDVDLARSEADLAEAAGHRPVKAYVEGRIAFDQGQFDDAVEAFQPALTTIQKTEQPPLADLRLYTAEALVRLNRWADAEPVLLRELSEFPSARARSALATVYRATGRSSEATSLAQH